MYGKSYPGNQHRYFGIPGVEAGVFHSGNDLDWNVRA